MIETFGERVMRLRRRLGLNQTAFGEVLGVDRKTVNAWESDRQRPFRRRLPRIAAVLRVTPEYLADGDAGQAYKMMEAAVAALGELATRSQRDPVGPTEPMDSQFPLRSGARVS